MASQRQRKVDIKSKGRRRDKDAQRAGAAGFRPGRELTADDFKPGRAAETAKHLAEASATVAARAEGMQARFLVLEGPPPDWSAAEVKFTGLTQNSQVDPAV
jgi:hypothetical protein